MNEIVIILVLVVILLLSWIFILRNKHQQLSNHKREIEIENKHILDSNNQLNSSNQKYILQLDEYRNAHSAMESETLYLKKVHENLARELENTKAENQDLKQKLDVYLEYEFENKNLHTQLAELKTIYEATNTTFEALKTNYHQLEASLQVKEQSIQMLNEAMVQQKQNFQETNQRIQTEIKQLSQQIFQENTEKLSNYNQEQISKVLNPLKEQIFQFNDKMQSQHHEQIRYTNTLNEKIKEIVQQTDYTSKIAENLANALKGDTKFQGDWGEMILENILQNAGLEENREYVIQSNFKNDLNENIRPDIIIQLPGDRKVVIDSKVSLTAYERFCNAADDISANRFLDEHIKSIKNHISLLSQKDYNLIPGSLDFVMLFIPIESAYVVALKKDHQLWNLAYQKKIILMSPTNLIASIRLIADLWKREYQHKNALKIASLAEKMHLKLTGFLNHFDEIGNQIQKSHQHFLNAQKVLVTGRGNLSNQLQQLKEMGIQSKNPIKNEMYFLDQDWSDNDKGEIDQ